MRQATTVTKSDVRQVHPRLKMLSNAPRFFDRLPSSSNKLRNSTQENSGIVTMSIYISSLRSFVSHYKATRFGRVLVRNTAKKNDPAPILYRPCDFVTRALYRVPVTIHTYSGYCTVLYTSVLIIFHYIWSVQPSSC